MFGMLTEKFQDLFSWVAGQKQLSEDNMVDAIRKVRLALLDADVNYGVVSSFLKRVKEKALGESVVRAVKPDEQFIHIVHEELVALMGGEEVPLSLKGHPSVILFCGLQGSGKTTQCAKLARYLLKEKSDRKILLVACDRQRLAAAQQLETLGKQVGVPVFMGEGESDPKKVAKAALERARKEHVDVLIVDTAGRLHVEEDLMQELLDLRTILQPQEIIFVASAHTGQDAVKTAQEFDKWVGISGSILTMLDGNARAGAALSIREITQKPLLFEGVGEKIEDFRPFHPSSMADRILGMGDVVNLVRKAQEHFTEEEEKDLEKKLLKASFTYEDYLQQMSKIKKMGSLKGLLKMMPSVPGMPSLEDIEAKEGEIAQEEAMILSMTVKERRGQVEMEPSRRRRIAAGSGTHVDAVNRLIKKFKKMKTVFKDMPSLKKQWQKEMGSKEKFLWH